MGFRQIVKIGVYLVLLTSVCGLEARAQQYVPASRICYLNWTDEEVVLLNSSDTPELLGRAYGDIMLTSEEYETLVRGEARDDCAGVSSCAPSLHTPDVTLRAVSAEQIATVPARSAMCEELTSVPVEIGGDDYYAATCSFSSMRAAYPMSRAFENLHGNEWDFFGSLFGCSELYGQVNSWLSEFVSDGGSLIFTIWPRGRYYSVPPEIQGSVQMGLLVDDNVEGARAAIALTEQRFDAALSD